MSIRSAWNSLCNGVASILNEVDKAGLADKKRFDDLMDGAETDEQRRTIEQIYYSRPCLGGGKPYELNF